MELATATALAGLASAGVSAFNSGLNMSMTGRMNSRSEKMMRESWAREDTAVQRRVADLKAAGLSPTLAAGSAASTSGPVRLETPKAEFDSVLKNSIDAMMSVQALRGLKLDNANKAKTNELLQKQIDSFGLPDWYNALVNIFGLDNLRDAIKGLGDGLFSSSPNVVNNIYESMMTGFDPSFKFAFTPNKPYTSDVTPASPEIVDSVESAGGKVSVDSDGSNVVVFESRAQARQWFLDIGGTTAEWYNGVREYGSPEGFLDWILGTGGYYFK